MLDQVLPYFSAIVGKDLLITFPDFQSLADLVLSDLLGYTLASSKESHCDGVRFHQGFLRDLTGVSGLLSLCQSSLMNYFSLSTNT